MKPHVAGNVAWLNGPAYDLARIITAHDAVIDALASVFGAPVLCIDRRRSRVRVPWPDPGKATAVTSWNELKSLHDVAGTPLTFSFPTFNLKARLLGTVWCVQDVRTDMVALTSGKTFADFDPRPGMQIVGLLREDGLRYNYLTPETVDVILTSLTAIAGRLSLDVARGAVTNHRTMKSGLTDSCKLYFPHDAYGCDGTLQSVHCVASDGGEPDPTTREEN